MQRTPSKLSQLNTNVKNIKRSYGTKIAILGFEREGRSTLAFLLRDPEFTGAEIWVLDQNESVEVPRGVHARLGADYLSDLSEFDTIFRSPGVRYHSPEIQRAIKQGVVVTSGTKLFFERFTGTTVGVTGTKGKGTTSTLIYEILKAGGKDAYIAGNIGKPPLDILPLVDKKSWVVLELSSFQLIDLHKSPHIGVALMITSEHLDWHIDVKDYVAAKSSIVRFQSPEDFAILAQDYPRSASYAKKTAGTVFGFSRRGVVKKGTYVKDGAFWFSDGKKKEMICSVDNLHIPGEHNWENAAAAITAGKIAGVATAKIKRTITHFHGLEHRLEFVREVNGVGYYNDSYSTTPDASEVAIQAFSASKIMILGGSHKNSDFTKLGKLVSRANNVKAVIGIGVEWPRIKEKIRDKKVEFIEGCETMEEIVTAAHAKAQKGDVVILSPGCASFGMFKNYTQRGEQFKACVNALEE